MGGGGGGEVGGVEKLGEGGWGGEERKGLLVLFLGGGGRLFHACDNYYVLQWYQWCNDVFHFTYAFVLKVSYYSRSSLNPNSLRPALVQ